VTRWTRRLLFGGIAMLVPVLAGCEAGQNAPTLTFHQASSGTSIVAGGITIDDAFVLGPTPGSALPAGGQAGFFVSLFAQNGDRLVSATAPGAAGSVKLTSGPVTLPAQELVNLSGPQPEIVLTDLTKPLNGGETIQLELVFSTEGAVSLQVPVEPAAYDYSTYSAPPTPTPTATPKATASASPSSTS
jgi:copper(I)-binding protein